MAELDMDSPENGLHGGVETEEEAAIEAQKIAWMRMRPKRQSIAADSVSQAEIMDYQKPVYPKDEYAIASIRHMLKENEKMQVLVGHLSEDQLMDVVNAFYMAEYPAGADIIRQDDQGDCLFVVASGAVDIYVARQGYDEPGDRGEKVVTYGVGQLFGELALLYNAPRAATVTAATDVVTWVLHAVDFKMLLAQSSQTLYAKYEGWLSQVSLFQPLNHFELSQLADILESELYEEGELILQQGDIGEKFYIVEEGTAAAYIIGEEGEHLVKEYVTQGDYFGEIALLTAEPRRASVRATGHGCSVASLSKDKFTAILGPITDKLKEHVDLYPQYAEFLR